jgi:ferredoxin-NADP reductase
MHAKEYTCQITENIWVTPTVMRVRFEPLKKFTYEPGQFVSLQIPTPDGRIVKRCYSLSSAPAESKKNGHYELCVKYVSGGAGSGYLASLKKGDTFRIVAPYGEFTYKPVEPGRSVCFIATGTGFAPFRSMAFSHEFQNNPPDNALCLFGLRSEEDLMYQGQMESMGVETIYALSKPSAAWTGYRGRVTDVLKALPTSWRWHTTDFYLCGNGEMVREVYAFLRGGHGVSDKAITKEMFSTTPTAPAKPVPITQAAKEKVEPEVPSILSVMSPGLKDVA